MAFVLHNDGRKNFLGAFYKNDKEAFFQIMDEMQNLRQKDDTINHFGFEYVTAIGKLANDIK